MRIRAFLTVVVLLALSQNALGGEQHPDPALELGQVNRASNVSGLGTSDGANAERVSTGGVLRLAVGDGEVRNGGHGSNSTPYWRRQGCTHSHPSSVSYKRISTIMRQPSLPKSRGARAWHYARCVKTRAKARAVRRHLLRLRTWRRTYAGYWTLQRKTLSSATVAMLNRLGGCETRGIPFPQNYRYSGHHHGRYQYLASTWQRAQGWVGVPYRYRTSVAYTASPAHQDVVTARFFPAHRGEWACSA